MRATAAAPAPAEAGRLRDPGSGAWYEVFYATAALGGGRSVWLRYTMLRTAAGEESCALWGSAFDRAHSRWFAARNRRPFDSWRARSGGGVHLGDAEIGPQGCSGEVEDAAARRLRWQLRWEPLADPFPYFPAALERAAPGATFPIAVVPLARARGTVEVDGDRLDVEDGLAEHTHLFGGRHARRWGWVHALGFDDDPEGFLTLIWARPQRAGGLVPAASSLALRLDGRVHRSGGLRAVRWGDLGGDAVVFSGRAGEARVRGVVRADGDRLTGVTYHDPDGARVHCANTEVAELEVSVRVGAGPERTLRCAAACGFERGGREPMPNIWRPL